MYPEVAKSDYESPYRTADKALKKAATASGNKTLVKISKEIDPKLRMQREAKCIAVRKVVDKCMDEYKEGEYTFKKAISEIKEALEYI